MPRSSHSDRTATKPGIVRTVLSVVVLAGLVLFLLSALFPIVLPTTDEPLRELNHLKGLYLGIKMYAGNHKGAYPPDLETLFRENNQLLKPPGGAEFMYSPRLHYFVPPSTANEWTAPLNPEAVILSYDHEKYHVFVTGDGSGRMERKKPANREKDQKASGN